MGRWHVQDPLAESYESLTPYNYVANCPLVFIDPDGRSMKPNYLATRYVDPSGRTIIDTDDGRDDVFIVPWNMVDEFTDNAKKSETTGHSNSTGWNDYWRSQFSMAISENLLNQFHSETAKQAYIDYAFSGELGDWTWFLLSEVGGQWQDPELVVQGLSMGVNGLYFAKSLKSLPRQLHHFATNKNKLYSPQLAKIAQKYGLDLDGSWNKEMMEHLGRHPNKYHDFVLDGMQRAASEAGNNKSKFLQLFNKYVKKPVQNNPQLLRKAGWE